MKLLGSLPDLHWALPRGHDLVADYCDVFAGESLVDLSGA
jgi:hypothetical protein